MSRVKVELTQETEAVKVVVTNDEFADDDPAYTPECGGLAADPFAAEDAPRDGKDISAALMAADDANLNG